MSKDNFEISADELLEVKKLLESCYESKNKLKTLLDSNSKEEKINYFKLGSELKEIDFSLNKHYESLTSFYYKLERLKIRSEK